MTGYCAAGHVAAIILMLVGLRKSGVASRSWRAGLRDLPVELDLVIDVLLAARLRQCLPPRTARRTPMPDTVLFGAIFTFVST